MVIGTGMLVGSGRAHGGGGWLMAEGAADEHGPLGETMASVDRSLSEMTQRLARLEDRSPAPAPAPAWRRVTGGEHRWPAALAIAAMIALQFNVPNRFSLLGWWVLPLVEAALLVGIVIVNPDEDLQAQPGAAPAQPDPHRPRELRQRVGRRLPRDRTGPRHRGQGPCRAAADRREHLAHEHPDLLALVLGARPRRTGRAGPGDAAPAGLRVPADDEPEPRPPRVGALVRRLPLPGANERHGVQPDGHACRSHAGRS